MNDAFIVGSHNFFLLDKATAAFKRELPVDRWHILCHSAHPALPTRRCLRSRVCLSRDPAAPYAKSGVRLLGRSSRLAGHQHP